MTPTLRVVLIVVSILTTFMIMREDPAVKTPDRGFDFLAGILVHSHCVQYLSGAAGSFGGAGGNVHDCQFYLSGGYFPPDCENVPYVDQTVAAGDEDQGSGAEDCAG